MPSTIPKPNSLGLTPNTMYRHPPAMLVSSDIAPHVATIKTHVAETNTKLSSVTTKVAETHNVVTTHVAETNTKLSSLTSSFNQLTKIISQQAAIIEQLRKEVSQIQGYEV